MHELEKINKYGTFLFIVTLISCSKKTPLKLVVPELKFDSSLQSQVVFVKKEFRKNNIYGKKIIFSGDGEKRQLSIEISSQIDPRMADKLFKHKSSMIDSIYIAQPAPYGSNLTQDIKANVEKGFRITPIIVKEKNQTTFLFNLKATERLAIGGFSEEQNVYNNQILLIYCKKEKKFYDLSYYYPKTVKPLDSPVASCLN